MATLVVTVHDPIVQVAANLAALPAVWNSRPDKSGPIATERRPPLARRGSCPSKKWCIPFPDVTLGVRSNAVCHLPGGRLRRFLVGLGGGIIVVPALTLIYGIDIRYAIGASIVSVIATSSGAAAAYVREGMTNLRTAMLLESARRPAPSAGPISPAS